MLNKEKPVEITFDSEKCTNCGICAKACHAEYLQYIDNKIKINKDTFLGCIQCGYCMMSCPTGAIKVKGEGISENDIFTPDNKSTEYEQLYSLLAKRRSARKFKDKEVSKEDIKKILEAASTGAISIPPYEVKVLVINGKEKVQEFAEDIIKSLEKMPKIMNPLVLTLFKPFIGTVNHKLFKEFVIPLINSIAKLRKENKDILFYDAPSIILFYTTELADKEDSIIASTLASTAAETLGMGTCIIGTVPPAINNNAKLKEKYGILKNEKVSTAFILGYPQTTFSKSIKRRFKEVRYR